MPIMKVETLKYGRKEGQVRVSGTSLLGNYENISLCIWNPLLEWLLGMDIFRSVSEKNKTKGGVGGVGRVKVKGQLKQEMT